MFREISIKIKNHHNIFKRLEILPFALSALHFRENDVLLQIYFTSWIWIQEASHNAEQDAHCCKKNL